MPKLSFVYFSWRGRISRKTYWLFSLPLAISYIAAEWYLFEEYPLAFIAVALPVIYLAMMINIKRSHDRGRTGWFALVLIVPIVALWPMVEFGFLKGDEGPNRFGEPALW